MVVHSKSVPLDEAVKAEFLLPTSHCYKLTCLLWTSKASQFVWISECEYLHIFKQRLYQVLIPHLLNICRKWQTVWDWISLTLRFKVWNILKVKNRRLNPLKRTCGPVVEYVLGDVRGRVIWGEGEVLCFATDQDKAEVYLKRQTKAFKYGSIEMSCQPHIH